jgi:hypothetical protein
MSGALESPRHCESWFVQPWLANVKALFSEASEQE